MPKVITRRVECRHCGCYLEPEQVAQEIDEFCPSLRDAYYDKYDSCFYIPVDITDDAQVLDFHRAMIIIEDAMS